jgi:hypothetical protein
LRDIGLPGLYAALATLLLAQPDGKNGKLNRAFPGLYRQGPAGYQLIYHNNTWKLFARPAPKQLHGH